MIKAVCHWRNDIAIYTCYLRYYDSYVWSQSMYMYGHFRFLCFDEIFPIALVLLWRDISHCPCAPPPPPREPTFPKYEYRGQFRSDQPMTSLMTSSHDNYIFWHNLGRYLKSNFYSFKMAVIFKSRQTFVLETIPENEYARKIAMLFLIFQAFDRCSSWNIDGDRSISKYYLLCDLMTSSMMSWMCKT